MAKRKTYTEDQLLGPTPQPSLASRLGSGTLGAISSAANILDTPGSMVRDTVSGHNPFDQLLAPWRDDNRISGRDFNRQMGWAGKKDTWGNWGGGLATEILTDPLTYLSFGGSALGKAGKALKAASALDDVGRIASKAAGKAPGTIGKRMGRLGLTYGDFAKAAPEVLPGMSRYAKKQGFALVADDPIGGLARNWLTDSLLGTANKGDLQRVANHSGIWDVMKDPAISTASKAAHGMDTLGNAVRGFKIPYTDAKPFETLGNLFNARAYNATDPGMLQTAGHIFDSRETAAAGARMKTIGWAHRLKEAGVDDSMAREFGDWLEQPHLAPKEHQPLVMEIRQLLDDLPNQMQQKGGSLADLNRKKWAAGSKALYIPAFKTEGYTKGGVRGATSPISGFTRSSMKRMDWTHGIDLKSTRNDMGRYVAELREMNPAITPAEVAAELEAKFAGKMPDQFITHKMFSALENTKKYRNSPTVDTVNQLIQDSIAKGGEGKVKVGGVKMKPQDSWKAAAGFFMSQDQDLLKNGVWNNHPLADIVHSVVQTHEAMASIDGVMSHLIDNFKANPAYLSPGKGKESLGQLLQGNKRLGKKGLAMRVGDRNAGAAKRFYQEAMGIDLSSLPKKQADKHIKAFRNMAVDADTAKFLRQAKTGWDTPEAVNGMLKAFDSWNAITKAVYTSARPAFHGRNTPGGWFNNAISGQFSGDSVSAGLKVALGQHIPGAAEIPIVKEIAAQRGIQALDDKAATEILRDLAYSHEMTGAVGAALPSHLKHKGSSLHDLLQEVPGEHPFRIGDVTSKLAGNGTTWNPFKAGFRGAFGATESTFAPVAAGEVVGNLGEHMNRFPPFFELLKQGFDPSEAAKRVRAAQVGYQNRFYTRTEQQIMQRVMLFYKYFRGQLPFTLKTLAERPSSPLGLTLRGLGRGKDPDELTPDWVADTTSIPLGTRPDGSRRYITGLGLPFEDPISFAKPSAANAGMELASRLNPVLKAPLEWMTGQSFFQRSGPHGRPLEDLDPSLGRTLANIGELTGLRNRKSPVRFPMSNALEHILSNSPVAPALTMSRTATDPRKGLLGKASNLLTGVKVSDISPAAQDRELLNRVSQIEKQLGGKTFSLPYIPDEVAQDMTEKERLQAAEMKAIRDLLAERSKARRKK